MGSRSVISDRLFSPPVQDNVVARVLLEHAGSVCPPSDPRRSVNYLDLSRLGEEGETPASDVIWLAVDSNGNGEDDKFLSSDEDTPNTYSVATDKLSTAATMAGHTSAAQGAVVTLRTNDLLEDIDASVDELGVLGRSSFDAEVEATARIQTILAGELIPLKQTLASAKEKIVDVNRKVGNMEGMLSTLNGTVSQLTSRVDPAYAQNTQEQAGAGGENRPVSTSSVLQMSGQEISLLDQLVTRIESLSTNVTNVEATRQLKEDNLLLKKDLQQYRDRELHLLTRMEALERRLNEVQYEKPTTEFVKTTELTPTPQTQPSSIRPRSRKGTDGIDTSAGPVELPPIQIDEANGKNGKPHSRSSSRKGRARSDSKSDSSSEGEAKISNLKQENINVPLQKAALLPPSKTKKPAFVKQRQNGSSSSSDENNIRRKTSTRDRPSRGIEPIETIGKGRPLTPEQAADFLQSEIQVARADNSILRQDLQVFRERESQLVMRNSTLEDKLIEQGDAILALHSSGGRTEPIGSDREEGQGKAGQNVFFQDEAMAEKQNLDDTVMAS